MRRLRSPKKVLLGLIGLLALGLSMGQWLTIPLFAVGLFFVYRALTRPPLGSGKPAAA